MNYANIKKHDVANGPGVRVSLFVSGCRHHCKECFNPETWNFNYGRAFTPSVMEELLNACDHEYIEGLTILGGEPFEPENQKTVLMVMQEFKKRFPEKSLWCYSGYTIDDLLKGELNTWHSQKKMTKDEHNTVLQMLGIIDTLVDGEFKIEERDLKLEFRGSRNQRLINVSEYIKEHGYR